MIWAWVTLGLAAWFLLSLPLAVAVGRALDNLGGRQQQRPAAAPHTPQRAV